MYVGCTDMMWWVITIVEIISSSLNNYIDLHTGNNPAPGASQKDKRFSKVGLIVLADTVELHTYTQRKKVK